MLPGPLEGDNVGMAGYIRHVFVTPHHWGVIRHMHMGRGAVDAGPGEELARELSHAHHHGRVRRELLGAQLFLYGCPHLQQGTGGCSGPHMPKDLGGRDLGSSGQRLLPFLKAIRYAHAASGVDEHSCWGLEVHSCWILRYGTPERTKP